MVAFNQIGLPLARSHQHIKWMIKHLVAISLFILFIPVAAQTQTPYFASVGEEAGVIQRSIFCVLQDNAGFMWFGTRDGLVRYDGYNTVEYRHDPDRKDSLGNNSVFFLLQDRAGNIWAATEGGGLNKYIPQSDSFVRYQHDDKNPNSLSVNELLAISEDKDGILWIGTNSGGLNCFDPVTESVTRFRHDPDNNNSPGNDTIWHLYHDSKGILWISTYGNGLDRFDPATQTFTHFRHDPNDLTTIASNIVGGVQEDLDGNLWVGSREGLNRLDQTTGRFQRFLHNPSDPYSISYNHVWDIHIDEAGLLWIGTYGGGLNQFDPKTGKVIKAYRHESDVVGSIGSDLIWQVVEDAGGIIWVATEGGGVTRFSRRAEAFGRHLKNPEKPFGLKHSIIASISAGRNNILWLANIEGGFQKMDLSTGEVTLFTHNPDNPKGLNHNNVMSIHENRHGKVWLGTYQGGLSRFDPVSETFTVFKNNKTDKNSLSDDRVWSLAEDSDDLWVGTLNGLNRLDLTDNRITRYMHNASDPQSISNNTIWNIYTDAKGGIWVGTNDGLNYRAPDSNGFKRYFHQPNNPKSLVHNAVMAITEDRNGRVWIGTDGGISQFDLETETFTNYTQRDGLVGDSVMGIVPDNQGLLWITTKRGLSKFNPADGRFLSYHQKDGIQDNEFISNAFTKTRDGKIAIGGTKGINLFDPSKIRDNTHLPPVVLTRFFRSEHPPILAPVLRTLKDISLSYKDKVFGFEFAALDYANPEKNQYAYMMEGFDKTWNLTTSKARTATYTTLDPGDYVFRVKASNNDGLWNETGVNVKLTISAPWWQSWWGRGMQILGVGFCVWGVVFWRIRSITRQKNHLEKMVSDRTVQLAQAKEKVEEKVRQRTIELEETNKALQKSEERYDLAMDASQDGLYDWDLIANAIYYSPGWKRMLGYQDDELPNDFSIWESLTDPDDVAKSWEMLQALIDKKRDRFEIEFKMKHKQGHWVDVLSRAKAIFDENAKAIRLIGTHVDISDQKKVEAELQSIEWLLEGSKKEPIYTRQDYGDLTALNAERLILDSIGDDVLADITKGYLELLETSSAVSERNGDYAQGVFSSGWCRMLDSASRSLCPTEDNREALACGQWLCHESCWRDASSVAIQKGEPIDIECHGGIRLYAIPIKANGKIIGAINFGYGDPPKELSKLKNIAEKYQIDVNTLMTAANQYETRPPFIVEIAKNRLHSSARLIGALIESKMAQFKLEAERERLRVTLESIGDGVITTDIEGNVVIINKEAEIMTGWRQIEGSGKKLNDIFHIINEQTQQRCENPVERVLKSNKTVELETNTVLIARDGTQKVIADSAAPIVDTHGSTIGVVLVFRDISEKIALEEALRHSHKMEAIGNLAGGIAHEFNNILSIIIGNNELILEDLPKWSLTTECAEEIKIAGMRARDVVKQLLTFSRQDSSERKVIDTRSVVAESLKLIRSSIPANINIVLNLSNDVYPIMANDTQINQLLINLCSNAADAMENEGDTITVGLSNEIINDTIKKAEPVLKTGRYVKIVVKDNGMGMNQNMLSRIFDPYYTTKEIGKGTGIGLAIVHGIVNRHGGSIVADSHPGKGTTFAVFLPAHEGLFKREKDEHIVLPTGDERILYVDDEPSVVKIGKRHLESLGYSVVSTTDPLIAFEMLKVGPYKFDLVITDMAMPKMTGDQLIRKILRVRPEMPTIICTGYSSKISARKAADIGISSFAMKPLGKADLAKMVRKVLDEAKGSTRA